eukprot:gb/GEZJ01003006.1/.p1 GENE.gb/GEZJ01003006.1/~~gb/GEZJ01003006.1/.p1  ORF type:complete len:243 (-),score=0.91 gb/GEZJ01003006.1/:579-1307(-)
MLTVIFSSGLTITSKLHPFGSVHYKRPSAAPAVAIGNSTQPTTTTVRIMFRTIFSFVLVVSAATASTCPTNLPYSSSIVGRSYSMRRPCYPARFVAYGTASVSDTEIKYVPFFENFNHGGVNPGYVCPQTYIFKVNKWAPMLTELPRLVAPADSGPLQQYCAREQERQKILSWPQGFTKNQFIVGMNKTIDGITFLRDHECWTPQYLPTLHTQEYLNAWLDGPITYLLSVAFNFGICLHTST